MHTGGFDDVNQRILMRWIRALRVVKSNVVMVLSSQNGGQAFGAAVFGEGQQVGCVQWRAGGTVGFAEQVVLMPSVVRQKWISTRRSASAAKSTIARTERRSALKSGIQRHAYGHVPCAASRRKLLITRRAEPPVEL